MAAERVGVMVVQKAKVGGAKVVVEMVALMAVKVVVVGVVAVAHACALLAYTAAHVTS